MVVTKYPEEVRETKGILALIIAGKLYFAADKAPGESHGEGVDSFGAKWYLLTPAGDKLDTD